MKGPIRTDTLASHSLTFFLGDLNFRINDLSDADVLLHIQNQNWGQLLKHDQVISMLKIKFYEFVSYCFL